MNLEGYILLRIDPGPQLTRMSKSISSLIFVASHLIPAVFFLRKPLILANVIEPLFFEQ